MNYIDLITQTGGVYDDICTSNYTNVLEQISQAVSDKINVQFELAYEPSGAVDIEIDGTPVVSYTVDGTTLTINDAVSDTAVTLEANYQHSPVSKTRFYSTNSGVDEDTLMVYMDDLLVAKDQYTYNSGTQQVEFNNLPPDRSKIDLMFRPNQVLPTEFDISNDLISGTMNVLVDGEPACLLWTRKIERLSLQRLRGIARRSPFNMLNRETRLQTTTWYPVSTRKN